MDGVICDLKDASIKAGFDYIWDVNAHVTKEMNEAFMSKVNAAGIEYWSTMKWMKNGKKLWDLIKPSNPIILSAYATNLIHSKEGKYLWIEKNLPGIRHVICFRSEKQKHAHPHAVLIDDKEKNIKEWEKVGGIGILYVDEYFENYIKVIQQYLR